MEQSNENKLQVISSRESGHLLETDGPWTEYASLAEEWKPEKCIKKMPPPGDLITKLKRSGQRAAGRRQVKELRRQHEAETHSEDFVEITGIMYRPKTVDLRYIQGDDSMIEAAVEQYFVYHPIFLNPYELVPQDMTDSFGLDWEDNARGIYYRHYYSPEWMGNNRKLWVPSVDGIDWLQHNQAGRRARSEVLLKHLQDNSLWNKSEYAWEADAWSDVFGQIRDDPLLSINKHDYYTMHKSTHATWCTLTEEERFVKRTPDATIGLATYNYNEPEDAADEQEIFLDRKALEMASLHRNCSLISDPRRLGSNLVFPFAVYEAKGLSGDPRVARRQACAAGVAYLDILDNLVQQPGMKGNRPGPYQSADSRNVQIFAFTSYGPHWHILVGYKRKRLPQEHAGTGGMSENVYVFHRIWSARIVTQRKAWELLALVDQITEWGKSDFRNMVVRHLMPWAIWASSCYEFDAGIFFFHKTEQEWEQWLKELPMPDWIQHVEGERRALLIQSARRCMMKAYWCWKKGVLHWKIALVCKKGTYAQSLGCPQYTANQAYQHAYTSHGGGLGDEFSSFYNSMFASLKTEPHTAGTYLS